MSCKLLPISEFASIAPAWDAINQEFYMHPLLEARFLSAVVKHFGDGNESIAVWGNPGNPDAIAVGTAAKLGVWNTFQPSQAPLGAFIKRPEIGISTLTAELFSELPLSCQILSITQQDPDIIERPEAKPVLRTIDYIDTARITVNTDFAKYWSRRGKNLRHNMKRQRNRVERESVALRLEVLTKPEQIREGVKSYGELESRGWKAKRGTAMHPDNEQGKFYAEMLEDYASTGNSRIYCLYYNDKLSAVDLCIGNKAALVILKTTYDETVRTSSPALLMRREYFPSIFDSGEVKRIEFYGKVMDWHTKWADEIRTIYHVNSYRSTVVALLHSRGR